MMAIVHALANPAIAIKESARPSRQSACITPSALESQKTVGSSMKTLPPSTSFKRQVA